MRVLVIGLKRELPLSPADALDIADRLVARAASAHTDGTCTYMYHVVCTCTCIYMHSSSPVGKDTCSGNFLVQLGLTTVN